MHVFAVEKLGPIENASSVTRRQVMRIESKMPQVCSRMHSTGLMFEPWHMAKARLLNEIVRSCEAGEVYTMPYLETVRTEIPNDDQPGTLLEARPAVLLAEADGVALASFRFRAVPTPSFDHTSVLTAALMDALINVRDRQYENIFLRADGTINLIDTLSGAFDFTQPPDSVMFPMSRLWQQKDTGMRRFQTIDFRCHVNRTQQLPFPIRSCLARIARGELTLEKLISERPLSFQVQQQAALAQSSNTSAGSGSVFKPARWQGAELRSLSALQARAQLILERGLEGTLERLIPSWSNRSAPRC